MQSNNEFLWSALILLCKFSMAWDKKGNYVKSANNSQKCMIFLSRILPYSLDLLPGEKLGKERKRFLFVWPSQSNLRSPLAPISLDEQSLQYIFKTGKKSLQTILRRLTVGQMSEAALCPCPGFPWSTAMFALKAQGRAAAETRSERKHFSVEVGRLLRHRWS